MRDASEVGECTQPIFGFFLCVAKSHIGFTLGEGKADVMMVLKGITYSIF